MSGVITVTLTDREAETLAALSNKLDLPQDRVLIQSLRFYEGHIARLGIGITDPPKLEECPHASPHVYCAVCKVSPCPLGLDTPKTA